MDDQDSFPEFELHQPFPLSGAVGVAVLCTISAALWIALIWTLLAVLG